MKYYQQLELRALSMLDTRNTAMINAQYPSEEQAGRHRKHGDRVINSKISNQTLEKGKEKEGHENKWNSSWKIRQVGKPILPPAALTEYEGKFCTNKTTVEISGSGILH